MPKNVPKKGKRHPHMLTPFPQLQLFQPFTKQARQDLNLQPPVLEFSPVFCVWLRLSAGLCAQECATFGSLAHGSYDLFILSILALVYAF